MFEQGRVLVAGGAGFLGSHLCRRLLCDGNEVICVDNLSTGRKRNISDLLEHQNFEFLRHDVTLPLYVEVDQIWNLACPASPVSYQADPVQTLKTSVYGSLNLLGLAKRTRSKIFLASTSEVYGDPDVSPQQESYWGRVNPVGIRSCYDEGKRCAETLFFDYHRQHKVNIRVARIFNTYGPGMRPDDGRVVSNFLVQALKGEPITVYGNGAQTRSFCYVDDLIDAFLLLMNSSDSISGPVNLGNPTEMSVAEIAQKILRQTESQSEIEFKLLPSDDPKKRCPDITLAKSLLGWQPTVDFEEGISRTLAYFREEIS